MSFYNGKYHIGLNSQGYIISQKNGVRYYQKKRAPTFVSKFGSGDSSYRDGTYWQYFAQTNWRNGAKQLKFDDPGKFWKSSDVDTTQLEELSLSKALVSAGQLAAGVKVNVIDSWRAGTGAQIAFDASGGLGGNVNPGTSISWSHTCSGNNRLLIVVTENNNSDDVSVTYNGVLMTKLTTVLGTSERLTYFYLKNPDAGTHTVTAIKSANEQFTGNSASYTGVLQTGTVDASSSSSGTATSFTSSTTTVADNCWVIEGHRWQSGSETVGTGTTNRTPGNPSVGIEDSNSPQTPPGAVSLTVNGAGSSNYIYIAASFAPALGTSSTQSTVYAGTSAGKVYSWDNVSTWTEVFDARKLSGYESNTNADKVVGDTGGTETAQSQGFQLTTAQTVKGIDVYLKKAAGTPGAITVRIETNTSSHPSGTLADANATATIPAFTTSTYGWVRVEFTTAFTLSAATLYHLVLETAAAANDNNYNWAADSAGSYSSGAMSHSTDGGTTWSADSGIDSYFRVLGNSTSINCSLITKVGGSKKLYLGTGDPVGGTSGDARLISFDGTTWALAKTFTTDAAILSIAEFSGDSNVYIGTSTGAIIYKTADFSSYTTSKDIDTPDNPGYPYAMAEYNSALYAGGGSPELIPNQHNDGFVYFFDGTNWRSLYPYEDTVIKSMEFYDSFLFFGTYFGFSVVFDSSSLNPLFNFKDQYNYQVQILAMKRFDDKLYMALYPQDGSGDTNVGIWVFDRRGFHLAHTVSGVTGFRCFAVANGSLLVGTGDDGYVYKLSDDTYSTTGYDQSSYFDANLPSIPKLYNSVVIRHDPLLTGQSINVYYKFKEDDSWTQLTTGADNSVGSIEQTLLFNTGVSSNKITLKRVLNGNGTNSPKLTECILQYALYPPLKWQWNIRIKVKENLSLADRTIETLSVDDVRSNLESLINTETLYTFVDVDGVSHQVLVNDIDQTSWVINPADVNEDEIALSLLEA